MPVKGSSLRKSKEITPNTFIGSYVRCCEILFPNTTEEVTKHIQSELHALRKGN